MVEISHADLGVLVERGEPLTGPKALILMVAGGRIELPTLGL